MPLAASVAFSVVQKQATGLWVPRLWGYLTIAPHGLSTRNTGSASMKLGLEWGTRDAHSTSVDLPIHLMVY